MSESDKTLTRVRASTLELPGLRLLVRDSGGQPKVETLGLEPLTLGTDASCGLALTDRAVSKLHCEISLTELGVRVRDLGSKNGTWIDRLRVVDALLPLGSTLKLGESTALLEVAGQEQRWVLSTAVSFGELVGASVKMRALFGRLERLAESDQNVLIRGESGTGKELAARALHDRSARREGPFAVLDCAALAPAVVEAELFGHARGAFTGATAARAGLFESAHGGTLFVDEVGELPLELQPRLLRALERREIRRLGETEFRSVDVRIVAATHRDLRALVKAGAFRADLFFRLAVSEVRIPPLREHKDDIPVLVERFLAAAKPANQGEDLDGSAMALLEAHDWPGNVRELKNAVARLLLFPDEAIDSLLGREPGAPSDDMPDNHLVDLPLREAREMVVTHFEQRYLRARIARAGGNLTRVATQIGVSRQFLYRLLAQHGIARGNWGDS